MQDKIGSLRNYTDTLKKKGEKMNDQEIKPTENFLHVQLTQNDLPNLTNLLRSIKEAGLDDRTIRVTVTTTIDIIPRE